jgi:hypothetical protein
MLVMGASGHSDAGGQESRGEARVSADGRIGSLYLLSTRRTATARGDCHFWLTIRAESVVNGVGNRGRSGTTVLPAVALTPRSCRAPWLSRWSMFARAPPL